jgi:hypothetical protein
VYFLHSFVAIVTSTSVAPASAAVMRKARAQFAESSESSVCAPPSEGIGALSLRDYKKGIQARISPRPGCPRRRRENVQIDGRRLAISTAIDLAINDLREECEAARLVHFRSRPPGIRVGDLRAACVSHSLHRIATRCTHRRRRTSALGAPARVH